jgi:molecular chaperone HscB
VDLTSNYFRVLSLPESYEMDLQKLRLQYHQLQRECHPDKFAGKSSQQQRLAEQYTVYLNRAFATLQSPLLRAEYLLTLKGIDADLGRTTHQDNAFLLEQMELQEALDEVRHSTNPADALENLASAIDRRYLELQAQFAEEFRAGSYTNALETLAKMHFFNKLQRQADDLEEELELF